MATESEAREALIGLTRITVAEMGTVFAELRKAGLSPTEARDALMSLLPVLGDEYTLAAAALAADWYDEAREVAGAAGRFRAEPVTNVTPARWQALVRWGVDPLFAETPDWGAALTLIEGGLQRTVADGHRLTVVENTQRDPKAKGWRRVGVGDNCGFCRMLIDRGGVYTEGGVTFRSHDHCNCAASPTWDESVVKVSPAAYEQSKSRPRSDAALKKRNQAAYDYIREHYGENAN